MFLRVPFFSFDTSSVDSYADLSIHSLNTQLNADVLGVVLGGRDTNRKKEDSGLMVYTS